VPMEIRVHPEAGREFRALDQRERKAMENAMTKLRKYGGDLAFPHSSRIRGPGRLRELRPRAGRSRWRALYRIEAGVAHIGAIVPEAGVDRRGFRTGVARATQRLED